ncbi:peptidoglycan bridge formation glycyltransferase FemA/FemB family protein [Streptococcus ictaluri]|uniref:FemAB family protein n=1 Tax=Streptococcus ictaluri 707-05 TaxID=764299 RepID=G5K288_9STRE|nr:peptidoglycan bridge formation glycyltransferase FemA/FemB family protein [Streptococcus ictaluri]EHI70296.1 FemAB family protein [Streptococcus ictaluri 707-05]
MSLREINKENYVKALQDFNSVPFMQMTEMLEFLERRGYKISYLAYMIDDKVEVLSSLLVIKQFSGYKAEINMGPLYNDEKYLLPFFSELKTYLNKHHYLEFVLKPNRIHSLYDAKGNLLGQEDNSFIDQLLSLGFKFDGLVTDYIDGEPFWHYIKDLSGYDDKTILSSFNSNSKRNIKKAKEYGILIRNVFEKEDIEVFKTIIEETGSRQGFTDKDLDYYITLKETLGEKAELLLAELNVADAIENIVSKITKIESKKEINQNQLEKLYADKKELEKYLACGKEILQIASVLLIYSPTEVTYLFGGSRSEYQKYSAQFLIQYEAMCRTMEAGINRYNFLGISGKFDGSDGVLRFKQNFNGYIERHYGAFRYYPNPTKIQLIKTLKAIKNNIFPK